MDLPTEPSPQAPPMSQMVKIVPNYGHFQRIASPYETVEKSSPVNKGQIKEVEKSSPVNTGQIITIDNSLPANAGQIIRNFNTNSEKSLPQNNGQIIKNFNSNFENLVAQKAGQIITVDNSSPMNTDYATPGRVTKFSPFCHQRFCTNSTGSGDKIAKSGHF